MGRRRVLAVGGVLLIIVLSAAAGLVAYLAVWTHRTHQHTAAPVVAGTTPSAVVSAMAPPLGPATTSQGTTAPAATTPAATTPAATAAGVAAALRTALAAPGLGSHVLASVVDADTGAVLLDRGAATPGHPASTAKIATATAVLATHAPTDRITTRVVAGAAPGSVVLVGGGDPTLSAAAPGTPTPYADAARLSTLAAQVRASGVAVTSVVVDDSLFTGPTVSPGWDPGDVPTSYQSAVTALMADGGRDTPTAAIRSSTPATSAADAFARDLGLDSDAVSTGTAPAGARTLASVGSATYATLVAQMLQQSDNVIADCLARQVAVARHAVASFTGAAGAVRATLQALGVDIGGGLVDGSGLAESADVLAPAALTGLLRLDSDPAHPALQYVLAGLPVAGWDGTLSTRFVSGSAAAGAGAVRAKTGTLGGSGAVAGVSTLAGVVHDGSGRLLSFAVIADGVAPGPDATDAAETALDQVAAALVGCGCD